MLTIALVFTLAPASASALNVDPTSSAPGAAQNNTANRQKEYVNENAADILKEYQNTESANLVKEYSGAESAGSANANAVRGTTPSGLAAIREKFAALAGKDKDAAGIADAGKDIASLAKNLGAPPVDANITKLPYKDTRTIDAKTHKVKIGDPESNETLEVKGYVYKVRLEKGAAYGVGISPIPSEVFAPLALPLDGNSNLCEDMMGEELDYDSDENVDGYIIEPRKSGVYYMLVLDAYEVLAPSGNVGGKYTFIMEKLNYLSGTVKDRKGKPIKNAYVEMITAGKKGAGLYYAFARTDKKGKYRIYAVAPGKYKMVFYKPNDSNTKPKYGFEYYNNRYTLKKAKVITMPAGKNKTGISVRLSAYTPPKVDKKVTKLPFEINSNIHKNLREILTGNEDVLPAKVYSVKLNKGNTYDLTLNGKKLNEPVVQITDSKGYYAAGFKSGEGDGGVASGSFVPPKTDTYRITVYDSDDNYYRSTKLKRARSGKFSLSVSKAFTPGSISGKATRTEGYPCEDTVMVSVYKKYGKRWISYRYDYTDAGGNYKVTSLKPGEYKVRFYEMYNSDVTKYYKKGKLAGVNKKAKGSAVRVYAGGTVRNINVKF